MPFVPLHNHSQYSLLDATATVKDLAKKGKDYDFPAIALTDHGNLFGAIEFYQACEKLGVNPIIGIDLYEAPQERTLKQRIPGFPAGFSLVVLAKNQKGYQNLCKLTSIAYFEGFYYYPRIDRELLEKHAEGLICLSGGVNSRIGHAALNQTKEDFFREVEWYKNLFGKDYYLELQRHHMSEDNLEIDGMYKESWLAQHYRDYIQKQERVESLYKEAAEKFNIKLVATNDSHYLQRDDWRAHEVFLNVQSGEPCEIWERDSLGNNMFRIPNPKRSVYPSHEFYLKNEDEMRRLFSDLPEAIDNTLEVASKCQLKIDFNSKHYPVYIPKTIENHPFTEEERAKAADAFLRELCAKGIPNRYTTARLEKVAEKYPGKDPLQVVNDRLAYELEIILSKGLGDYLLIVWDFIHWAKQNNIPVGPGRGSGAGSIICYLIGITDIEPLRFNLFFERFINPERMSYPDIDVDICMDKRDRVIEYTVNKYGRENVAQIITFGSMKAKMVVKDVGRTLSIPLAKVNAIAKLIPEDLGITLEKALEIDPDLADMTANDEETRSIMLYARKLEGSIRNTGIHAAGVIISGEPLTNNIPICSAKDSTLAATQYSMKPVEAVGMLKIDFLGLKTLTSIQICVDAIRESRGITVDWMNLPLDDQPSFNLLNHGKTLGVFQMESGGMQDLARQLHLDKFEEIIAVLSLYRPGPMDMIPSFIARKHGREPIEYDHPGLEGILSETYGIMVYQEQVMQIAQNLAGFSLGEGDVLRRAMGKKDAKQMSEMRQKFISGAKGSGIPPEAAEIIFDKMEKFAAYGFNKSHAAAYGYITYVTAYLKANFSNEWMAALMTCDSHDITKVAKFIHVCQEMAITILPPDVNEAGLAFAAVPKGIRFAITAIKGVGEHVVEAIIAERKRKGPFKSLYDFLRRVDGKKVGKKNVECLIDAGCFDFTGWTRDQMIHSVEPMFDSAAREHKDAVVGAMSLFAVFENEEEGKFFHPPKLPQNRSKTDLLFREKELLGFFLTGHPLSNYKSLMTQLSCVSLSKVSDMDKGTVFRAAFLVESVAVRVSQKNQKKFAILNISEGNEIYELPIWADLYEEKAELIKENQIFYAVLVAENQPDGSKRLSCKWLDDLTQANDQMLKVCDDAFDKEKLRVTRMQQHRDRPKKEGSEVKEKKEATGEQMSKKPEEKKSDHPAPPSKVKITLNADITKLSHIIELKNIFSASQGVTPVEIDFYAGGESKALVHINQQWGVTIDDGMRTKLQAIPSVVKITG
jgi:DNA polymerase-3 subunit alpha